MKMDTARPRPKTQFRATKKELRALLARVETASSNEKKRLARQIHSDLTQKITVLSIELSLLKAKLEKPDAKIHASSVQEAVSRLLTTVKETSSSLKRITEDLHPRILESFGFAAAVESMLQKLQEQHGFHGTVTASAELPQLSSRAAYELYLICSDVIYHAVAEAEATKVNVVISTRKHDLQIEILSNGNQFAFENLAASLCLVGAAERAIRTDGKLTADSNSKGTRFRVRVPLKRAID